MSHALALQKVLCGAQEGGEGLGVVLDTETAEMADSRLALTLSQRINLRGDPTHIAAVATRKPEADFRPAQKRIGLRREGLLALHHEGRSPCLVVLEH